MHSVLYMKTITISNEIYNKLVTLKGNRTFNEVIDELIRKNVNKRIDLLVSSLETTGFEEELEEIYNNIRSNFRVRI